MFTAILRDRQYYFFKDSIYLFRERGKEGEREGNINVREKH